MPENRKVKQPRETPYSRSHKAIKKFFKKEEIFASDEQTVSIEWLKLTIFNYAHDSYKKNPEHCS